MQEDEHFFLMSKSQTPYQYFLAEGDGRGGITAEPLRKAANLLIKWALHQRPFVKYLFRVSFPIKTKEKIFGDLSNAALLDHGT